MRNQLGFRTSFCNWILDFLTNQPQSVRLDNLSSSGLSLSTVVPQGCVLSPLLYSLFLCACVPVHGSNSIIKFADDTTVAGLIRNHNDMAYRDLLRHLVTWCAYNNLALNTQKTKEITVDFHRTGTHMQTSIYINGAVGEQVSTFRFINLMISPGH